VLADELLVIDVDSPLWPAARPLLNAALNLEQNDASYSWHGWNRQQINTFLNNVPSSCSLLVGVWETGSEDGYEYLTLGIACEIVEGEVRSIRTFEALIAAGLKPIKQLEPGYEDALEIMRAARVQIAPVAWALFTDQTTWNEWLFACADDGGVIDKGELLASFARQGRCVLLTGG
jgi:hypothetical protein